MISTSEKISHRKRSREVEKLSESLDDSHLARANQIKSFSLEAIFHPKFDNENRETQSIRNQMIKKMGHGEGYLEVSLKHSGNLLLWSGGQQFYSKNSTGTAYTSIGELLLRQHFFRSWHSSDKGEIYYQECSKFIAIKRLTLAFEVVSAVLGHHGDLPKKDFLILTAIADKSIPRFYNTIELLEFAHVYRLPHNDIWVQENLESVEKLFSLYDSIRETGLAGNTIRALTSISDAHVSSIYPHVEFQGEILEGIVIRYISSHGSDRGESMATFRKLDNNSTEILKAVPHDTPMSFELIRKHTDGCSQKNILQQTNIRDVYNDCVSEDGYDNLTARVGDVIDVILKKTDSLRRRTNRDPTGGINILKIAKSFLETNECSNDETRRIASVIVKLDEMNAAVRYPVFEEESGRLYCTVHVLHDKTFFSYEKKRNAQDLHLYRGFFLELKCHDQDIKPTLTAGYLCDDIKMQAHTRSSTNRSEANLMLKMKLLPYMVRTFCCRNGLKIIMQNGIDGFTKYNEKLMKSWGISSEARAYWQPFLLSWGKYVCEYRNSIDKPYIDKNLPPLTSDFYLNHLQHFIQLYENDIIKSEKSIEPFNNSTYKAMVVVVAIKNDTALIVSKYISEKLGGVYIHENIHTITEDHLINMRAERGGGLITFTSIETGPKVLKKIANFHGKHIYLLLYGCNDNLLETNLSLDSQKLKGMAKSWRKLRVAVVKDVNFSPQSEMRNNMHEWSIGKIEEMKDVLMELNDFSDRIPALDMRQGLLVFFPLIPGSGKSCLSSQAMRSNLNEMLKNLHCNSTRQDSSMHRKLVVLVGDEYKKRYYQEVKKIRAANPSSLFIADKNAPPNAWQALADSIGNGIAVPVIPDEKALSTTRIEGMCMPSGEICNDIIHYYPFSLHYLATCLTRVLTRPVKSHVGGLDKGLKNAAMIVINFFGFYQNITAEVFLDNIQRQIEQSRDDCPSVALKVSFFIPGDLLDLPIELSKALIDALRLRCGFNKEKKDPTKISFPAVKVMEQRLREAVEKHKTFIFSLQVKEERSRKDFLNQITYLAGKVNSHGEKKMFNLQKEKQKFILLVSIDIPIITLRDAIREILEQEREVKEAFKSLRVDVEKSWMVNKNADGIIAKPHVTMAHHNQFSQSEMRLWFSDVIGNDVDISLSRFLWNQNIAAFEVELPAISKEGNKLHFCRNKFVHLTFWKKGVESFESNNLPSLVEQGLANCIYFSQPKLIKGIFSFWNA